MTEKSRSKNILRTTDLAMAAYLRCKGYDPDLSTDEEEQVKQGHPQGTWEFDGDAVATAVRQFTSGHGSVEPRAFHGMLNRTRREMFEFLGIGS